MIRRFSDKPSGRISCSAIIALWLFTGVVSAQSVMEIFALRHRTVEEVIALIQPLVPSPGVVTGMSGQLVVRTSPDVMADVRQVLDSLDTPARQLIITVREGGSTVVRERGYSGAISTGNDTGRVRAGSSIGGNSRAGVRLADGSTRVAGNVVDRRLGTRRRGDFSVRVLEGRPAYIRTGKSVPYQQRQLHVQGGQRTVTSTTEFVDVSSGFYVLPRMAGEQVILEIAPRREQLRVNGNIATGSASTTLRANLGEWVSVGGVSTGSTRRDSAIGAHNRTTTQGSQTFQLRVEALD